MNASSQLAVALLLAAGTGSPAAEVTDALLAQVKSVAKQGQGNVAAGQALRQLAEADPSELPRLLAAFDGAGPLAANYLRSAVESVADQAVVNERPLPTAEIARFVADTANDPRARALGYDLLVRADGNAAAKLVPGFLQDPSAELRRVAVSRLLDEARAVDVKASPEQAKSLYETALSGAVDADQVKEIVGPLKKLGVEVDLQEHFGFLADWQIVGPFENRGGKGFAAVYPPERKLDLAAEYPTEYDLDFDQQTIRWQPVSTQDDYGSVDILKQLTNWKGSCVFAATTFVSAEEQTVQLRLGTPNAWKLWVNGEELFAREEYHRSTRMDQYRVPAKFRQGVNTILLKVCQNEQTQDWAQDYKFQIRVSDGAGGAVLPARP